MDSRNVVACANCNWAIQTCECVYKDIRELYRQVGKLEKHIHEAYLRNEMQMKPVELVSKLHNDVKKAEIELKASASKYLALQNDYHALQQELERYKQVIKTLQGRLNRTFCYDPGVCRNGV